MSLYIDRKFINLISSQLEKFKWKGDNLANCRCKICGDSQRNKNKARGYFFTKNDNFFYKCHNCNVSMNIYGFLEKISPSLCKEYSLENFKAKPFVVSTKTIIPTFDYTDIELPSFVSVNKLSDEHKAVQFLKNRKIPKNHWDNIGYCEDFSQIAKEFDEEYMDNFEKEERLIIKINSCMGLCGIQGRSFKKYSKAKYITLKQENKYCFYNYNQLDINKPFIVTEGPFDSMFFENSIATLGIGSMKTLDEKIDDSNATYVLDNEPYNKQVVQTYEYLIENNKKVVIFPENIRQKDINDMVLDGIDISDIINNHSYCGMKAKLIFSYWKKT
jgi:hypothetical protein